MAMEIMQVPEVTLIRILITRLLEARDAGFSIAFINQFVGVESELKTWFLHPESNPNDPPSKFKDLLSLVKLRETEAWKRSLYSFSMVFQWSDLRSQTKEGKITADEYKSAVKFLGSYRDLKLRMYRDMETLVDGFKEIAR